MPTPLAPLDEHPSDPDALAAQLYDELRRIARRELAGERPDHTLQPTALLHEAYLRLLGDDADFESRAHFFGAAATTIRRVLVDVLELRRASGSPRDASNALFGYGRFLSAVGSLDEALAAFDEAVTLLRDAPGSEPLALGRAELALGECLVRLDQASEAAVHLREAKALLAAYPAAASDGERAERLLAEALRESPR